MPSEVSEEIILTHPAVPATARFDQSQTENLAVISPALIIDAPIPAEGHYFWIPIYQVRHDDPVARNLSLGLIDTISGVLIEVKNQATVLTNIPLFGDRGILVPARWRLRGTINALAATQVMTLSYMFMDLLVAETPPPL